MIEAGLRWREREEQVALPVFFAVRDRGMGLCVWVAVGGFGGVVV